MSTTDAVSASAPVASRSPSIAPSADPDTTTWLVRVRRSAWRPRDVDYLVRLGPDTPNGMGIAATDPVFIGRTTYTIDQAQLTHTRLDFRLVDHDDEIEMQFSGSREGDDVVGVAVWDAQGAQNEDAFVATRRTVRRFDRPDESHDFEEAADPEAVGLASVLVDRLVLAAEEARSDGLVVLSDGHVVVDRSFGHKDDRTPMREMTRGLSALVGTPSQLEHAGHVNHGLFSPLDIVPTWGKAASGETDMDQGLVLGTRQLAVVGMMLAQGGKWSGARVVPEDGPEAVKAAASGERADLGQWQTRADRRRGHGQFIGYSLRDREGQLLAVYPDVDLVVVRTSRRAENSYDARYRQRDRFEWAEEMADALAVDKAKRAR